MKFVIGILAALLFAGTAVAAVPLGHGGNSMPGFEQLDKNKNGSLSRDEASQVPKLDFEKADTNRDRKLSRAEYERAAAKMGG